MKQITLQQYLILPPNNEYSKLLQHLQPNNSLGFNLNKLSYNDVISLFHLVATGTTNNELIELFKIAFQIKKKKLLQIDIVTFFENQNFLFLELKKIKERENKLLKSNAKDLDLWEHSGGKRLNAFSNLMPLVSIGKIYSIFPYDLQKKPYIEILTLLTLHKTENEVSTEFNKLRNDRYSKATR